MDDARRLILRHSPQLLRYFQEIKHKYRVACRKLLLAFTWELRHVTKLGQAAQHPYQSQQKLVADH